MEPRTRYEFIPRKTEFATKRKFKQIRALEVFQIIDEDTAETIYFVKPCSDSIRARKLISEYKGEFTTNPSSNDILAMGEDIFIKEDELVMFCGYLKPRNSCEQTSCKKIPFNRLSFGSICTLEEIPCDYRYIFLRLSGEYTFLLYFKIDNHTAKRVCNIDEMMEIDAKLEAAKKNIDGTLDTFCPKEMVQIVWIINNKQAKEG